MLHKKFRKLVSCLLLTVMLLGIGTMSAVAADEGSQAASGFARLFPDTTNKTMVFVDQLPTINSLTQKQIEFIANKYVGAQKLTVPTTRAIRAINPNFIMLHYHLAIWQSYYTYIVDGYNWSNDDYEKFPEEWFMHRFNPETGEVYMNKENRVQAYDDYKFLMNVMNEDYYQFFLNKMKKQCADGEYDGIFLDSYHTAVVGWYLQNYPEYAGTTASFKTYPELGQNMSWQTANEIFMDRLTKDLNAAGLYSLPNLGNFATTWDKTDYTLSDGGMTESAFSYYNLFDWKQGMNGHLKLINNGKIDMMQEYLSDPWSYERRLYFLSNYLLLRGKYTYINYFNGSTFRYYPEYDLDVGAPVTSAGSDISNLEKNGLFVRDFEKAKVIVCPRGAQEAEYVIPQDANYKMVNVRGTGDVDADGNLSGSVYYTPVSGSVTVKPQTALIIVKDPLEMKTSDQLLNVVDYYKSTGELSGEVADLLPNKIRQAQHQLDKDTVDQAIKHMDDFLKHLNNPELVGFVSKEAKFMLDLYAKALIGEWEN